MTRTTPTSRKTGPKSSHVQARLFQRYGIGLSQQQRNEWNVRVQRGQGVEFLGNKGQPSNKWYCLSRIPGRKELIFGLFCKNRGHFITVLNHPRIDAINATIRGLPELERTIRQAETISQRLLEQVAKAEERYLD